MSKYVLEIDTDLPPEQMIPWVLQFTEDLPEHASWALTRDGKPVISLQFELRGP